MSALSTLLTKIRQKGLRACLRILCERYLYCRWELLTLERRLDLPIPVRTLSAQRTLIERIEHSHLPMFTRHFSRYRRAVESLLDQGLRGTACCDDQNHIIAMLWVSERDYYDDQLYHCWVRLPPGCIYQFAGEVAQPYRGSGSSLSLVIQRNVWEHYRQRGFKTSRALVNARNQISLRLLTGLGFEEIGEIVHIYRLFGCLHYTRTTPYHEPRLLHLHKKQPAAKLMTMQESA